MALDVSGSAVRVIRRVANPFPRYKTAIFLLVFVVIFWILSSSLTHFPQNDSTYKIDAVYANTELLLSGKYVPSIVDIPNPSNATKYIPSILHQSWKTADVPVRFSHWRDTWKKHHPGWHICVWTDEDNLRLVKDYVPWFLKRYETFPTNIHRADSVRYVYMYIFGGFYSDLDIECLKSHEPLREKDAAVFGLMSGDLDFEHNIPNAWFGSPPGHPFWLHLLKKINGTFGREGEMGIEGLTGPVILYHALKEYEALYKDDIDSLKIEKLPPGLIYPYDWHDTKDLGSICSAQSGEFDPTQCKARLDPKREAYTVTYWSHTWGDDSSLERMKTDPNKNNKKE